MPGKSDKAFDSLMQEKFRDFKAEPSAELWGRISAELDKPAKKRFPFAWLSAAAVLIFATLGLWFNASSPIRVNETAQGAAIRQTETSKAVLSSSSEKQILAQNTKSVIPKPEKIKSPAVSHPQVFADVPAQAEPLDTEGAKTNASSASVVASEPLVAVGNTDATLPNEANTIVETTVPVEEETVHRQRGTLGRLVNKLVARVDARDDKLIEVSEDAGEGLKITGLNLGLLKLKTINTNK